MLYFFHDREMVIVSHCLTKQQAQVPPREIELEIRRKQSFDQNLNQHTFDWAGE